MKKTPPVMSNSNERQWWKV